jgi:hypothetical protein
MKNWVAGKGTAAAKVDPAIAAIVTAVVELVVMFDLHTKLGLSPEDLLKALLHVAVIATLARTIQLNVQGRKRQAPAPTPAPAEPEPARFDPPPTG